MFFITIVFVLYNEEKTLNIYGICKISERMLLNRIKQNKINKLYNTNKAIRIYLNCQRSPASFIFMLFYF
jgi:hypothetical protein